MTKPLVTLSAMAPVAVAAADGLGWAEQHGSALLWLLAVLFSAVLFFIRTWMSRRERAEDTLSAALTTQSQSTSALTSRLVGIEERQTAHVEKMAAAVEHLDRILSAHLEEEPRRWEESRQGQVELIDRISKIEGEQGRVKREHRKERLRNGRRR